MDLIKKLMLSKGQIDGKFFEEFKSSYSDAQLANILKNSVLSNSLLRLSPESIRKVFSGIYQAKTLNHVIEDIIYAQEMAKLTCQNTQNILFAAMPKSGSSFLSRSIEKALGIPFFSLTTSNNKTSEVGLNGREQEICELSLVKRALTNKGFVAQHHMKGTPYLAHLLKNYNTDIIVTFRNIFDGIVSFDEMLCEGNWQSPFIQSPLKIPTNYKSLPFEQRVSVVANNYGIWCIDFYLSWKRLERAGQQFQLIEYDKFISLDQGDKAQLSIILSDFLRLDCVQREALHRTLIEETGTSNKDFRFNKGKRGRGDKLPKKLKQHLFDYASKFHTEIGDDDIKNLFGATY